MKKLLFTLATIAAFTAGAQTIESGSHSTTGYVKSDGTVENSSHSTIGHVSGVKKEWAAVVFFFFKF